jgi:hypothetical protein
VEKLNFTASLLALVMICDSPRPAKEFAYDVGAATRSGIFACFCMFPVFVSKFIGVWMMMFKVLDSKSLSHFHPFQSLFTGYLLL